MHAPSHPDAALEALLARLDAARAPRERADLLVAIAERAEELAEPEQAFDALLEAWRADPTFGAALLALERHARAQSRWAEVFRATEELVAAERDAARALALCDAMVRWLTRDVPTPELARHYVERIRAMDTTHWAVHLFQAATSREHGDVKRALEEIDRALLSAKRADDRVMLHLLLAARYGEDRTANAAEAKKHYDAAAALDPSSMDALRGLEALAARAEDWPALADVVERQIEATKDDVEREALLLRVAELHEKRFLKPDVAAARLERVFALNPTNTDALASLERCYRAARAWTELVSVFERSAVMIPDAEGKAARLRAIAEVHESKLGDLEAARRAWERLAELSPDDQAALGEVARLSEKLGDVEGAVNSRRRMAESAGDPAARARAHFAAAQALSTAKREPTAARAHLEEAVALDPTLAAAWSVLLWTAKDEGDFARVARYLEERAEAEQGPRMRAQLFVELAQLRERELGEPDGALRAYASALEADPDNEAAAAALLGEYIEAERWDDAAHLHEIAILAAERDQDAEKRFALLRTGRAISIALGHLHVALASALKAYELRPSSVDAQAELIASARAMKDDADALSRARDALDAIARAPGGGLGAGPLAELAELFVALGDTKQAYATYDEALTADPTSRPALEGLAALCAMEKDVVVATALKRRLAHTLDDADEKLRVLLECAEALVAAGKIELAVEAYEEARAVRPADRAILHALLAHATALERWAHVAKILRAIADSDDDKRRKGKTIAALAQLVAEKLGDKGGALRLDEEALDLDVSRLEAFERVVRAHTEDKDWRALLVAYERMLARARAASVDDPKLLRALHHQAGLVCRDRLGDRARAVGFFRAAAELDPTDAQAQSILRELLEITGRVDDALGVALERVRVEPLAADAYPPLVDVALQAGAVDRAWCAASVAEHLGALGEAHAGFYRSHPPAALEDIDPGGGALDARLVQAILHPELDPNLTALFEIVAPALIDLQLARIPLLQRVSHPGPSLPRPRAPDVTAWLPSAVERAAAIFGVDAPRLYVRKTPGAALSVGATRPPSLLVAVDALMMTPREHLAFLVGKRVFELSPPLLARALCPTVSELSALVAAAVNAALGVPGEPLRAHLKGPHLARLAEVIQRAQASGGELDVKRWSRLADLSASRAGLVLAGDVKRARAALAAEPQSPGDLPLRDQMRELVVFAMSDAHHALRRALGVGLGGA